MCKEEGQILRSTGLGIQKTECPLHETQLFHFITHLCFSKASKFVLRKKTPNPANQGAELWVLIDAGKPDVPLQGINKKKNLTPHPIVWIPTYSCYSGDNHMHLPFPKHITEKITVQFLSHASDRNKNIPVTCRDTDWVYIYKLMKNKKFSLHCESWLVIVYVNTHTQTQTTTCQDSHTSHPAGKKPLHTNCLL